MPAHCRPHISRPAGPGQHPVPSSPSDLLRTSQQPAKPAQPNPAGPDPAPAVRMHSPSLCLLALALLCLSGGPALAKRSSNSNSDRYQPFYSSNSNSNGQSDQLTAPAFQKGQEYQFQYNAQIASGLIAQDEQSQADAQQKAITRIQAQARITFASQRHAQLCLRQIRAGQLNEPVKDEQEVQPMSIFEPKEIPTEKKRQLELCCQFGYADGVIERVQFQQEDDTWSKNIKRGVLQMIQLNLKQNNAQGLRQEDGQQQQNQEEQEQQNEEGQQQKDPLADSFTIPEITVEGQCQTQYTINTANPSQRCSPSSSDTPCSFNVTKSINFKQCSKVADVAFGFQRQQPQPECAQCQMDWYKQQQEQQQTCQGNNCFNSAAQQQANGQHPCAKCDPKEVKEQKVDRTTVLRYVLRCGEQQQGKEQQNCPNCCQLQRTELLSQYVYKNSKTENGPYGAAMHTVVSAELQLRSVQPQQQEVPTQSSAADEALMYSNQWETDEKRFYMFGDEEYPSEKSGPFHQVPTVQQAEQALRKMVQATQNQQQGIEPQQAIQVQRFVQMLRMCTQRELKQIQDQAEQHPQDQLKAKQIYLDALATCGTRNCVKQLVEKIKKQDMSPAKYACALNQLNNLPAPSDTIVETVQQLCQSEQIQKSASLKQSCWLTFGALVNELCQHKTQKASQQSVFGMQSGFQQQEQCPANKKEQYKQAMLEQFEQARNTYEKVLALSALGNAGIDTATTKLEEIIQDRLEQRVVRVKAIDALRRLAMQQPRQIQQILLPIFQNVREQPQVRTAAFAICMYTLPEQSVVDQLAYAISQEPNKQVQAFAYRTMKTMAYSQNPAHEQIAKHAKNALKLCNVDEQQLRASGKWQMPMFSQQQQEGLFITLASTISQRSALPAYAHAQIDSVLNDQFHINTIKLYLMQQEAEQWYEQAMSQFGKTRGQRQQQEYNEGSQSTLRDIYSSLGIKSRRSIDQQQQGGQQQQQQPFAMACLRIGDVDQAFIALDEQMAEQEMPTGMRGLMQALKSGQKPSLARVLEHVQQQQQIRATIAINLNEQEAVIPTSCGVPLRMTNSAPVLATIQGSVKIETDGGNGGVRVKIDAQPMANGMHIRRMECWTPFLVSGVESIRSVEANIPLHAELSTAQGGGLQLKLKLPQQKTQLFGAHSLPVAYAAEVQQKSGLVREPRHVRAIQNDKLNRQQHEMSTVVGAQNFGIPMHIHANYHWPSQPTNYQQFLQMLLATENSIHVTCQPGQDSPREVQFRLSGEHFQPSTFQMGQELNDFYANQFDQADEDEQEYDPEYQQQNSHGQRRQKLQSFLGRYQPGKQYKHGLKLSAQTIGGAKQFKADAEVQAHCDGKLQVCSVQADMQRSPMGGEQQQWTLKAQAQLVMPETVAMEQEMSQLSEKNNKFTCKAQCAWGEQQNKQQINIRIKGEQAMRSAMQQFQQQQGQKQGQKQQQQNRLKRRTAFLNKFDLECAYNGLKPSTQNTFNRVLELVKSAYFWNSKSELIPKGRQQQESGQSSGKVLASMVIDPITQKHANITVKMPTQLVRLQQIELPVQARPFPLVRQNAQNIGSIGQFISRQELNNRAECAVDGNSVDTFDDQEYSSRLSSKCYSVLAKDCSSEQPDFVVLMKAIPQQQQKGTNGQKKLKVISRDATIECQPRPCSGGKCQQNQQPIQCKVNGQSVQNDDEESSQYVDFNNGQKSDVTVHAPGAISVRFNGRKAWLKVSSMYKNRQCGLCGHYDDSNDDQDEWRMGDNRIASDLSQFHRSYTLKNGEECSQQEMDTFYQQNGKQIRKQYQKRQQQNNDSDEEDDDEEMNNGNGQNDWEQENFNGNFDSSEEDNTNDNDFEQDQQYNRDEEEQKSCKGRKCQQQPRQVTKVVEMDHQVCFSMQPVKKCPSGSVPSSNFDDSSSSSSSQQNDNDDDDDQNEGKQGEQYQNQQQKKDTKNVAFTCMPRSSQEARRLLRQYRRGQKVLNVSGHAQSYMEKVREPQTCRRL